MDHSESNLGTETYAILSDSPAGVREKVKVFLVEVDQYLSFFREWGFSKKTSSCSDDIFPYCVRVAFRSFKADREVVLAFFVETGGQQEGEILSVSIWKELCREGTARGWDANIWPEVYLSQVYPDFDLSSLELCNHEGQFKERLQSCLRSWVSVLQNELRDIVMGKKWVDGMYVTPID